MNKKNEFKTTVGEVHPEFSEEATGAVRGTDLKNFRYDLLPFEGIRRLALTCKEGADKYGAHNWRLGFRWEDLYIHIFEHTMRYGEGDRSEDHIGHILWGWSVLAEIEKDRPELCVGRLGHNKELTEEILQALEKHKQEKLNAK